MNEGLKYFKAFIRVVKSLNREYNPNIDMIMNHGSYFGYENIVEERLIIAKDKEEVKAILLEKYPQFFPNNKIYSKETKDDAQFFYVLIYELYDYEIQLISERWSCANCGHQHENKYLNKPRMYEKLFGERTFCKSDDDHCLNEFKKKYYENTDMPDDETYITKESNNYIYRITEKNSGKCYIGKTKNAPFFRWWNHLTHSSSPFGLYLRNETKLSDWTFEILEILPSGTPEADILKIESQYIVQFNSIENGFNTVISNKSVLPKHDPAQHTLGLFEEQAAEDLHEPQNT